MKSKKEYPFLAATKEPKKEIMPTWSNSNKEKGFKQLKAKLRKAILHKSPEE